MRVPIPFLAAVSLTAATAFAQPAPAPAPAIESQHGWSAQAGYETFSLRDISRHMRPPDASPIAWRGEGPAVHGRYDITRTKSSHLVDATWRQARSFSYDGPTRSIDAFAGDSASRLEARYEYRRYFWRDLGIDGFDAGVAVQAIGSRTAVERHITASLHTRSTMAGGGGAGVIVARLRRWDRIHVDASWANGAVISHRSSEHNVSLGTDTFSGGNLLSDTAVRADWRLTRAARLSVGWRRYFEEYASDHYPYAAVWHSLNVGVLYAR